MTRTGSTQEPTMQRSFVNGLLENTDEAEVKRQRRQSEVDIPRCPICIQRSQSDVFFGLPQGGPCSLCYALAGCIRRHG